MTDRPRRAPPLWDALLALAVLGVGELQIFSPDPHRVIANTWFSAVLWPLTCLALGWRRSYPGVVFVVVVVGLTVEAVPAPDSGTFAGFIALCVALYSFARAEPRPQTTVAASAIALLALLFHYSRDPDASNAVESIQATYVVLIACPVSARMVAARAERGNVLEAELAAQEQHRDEAARAAVAAERARIARELHDVIAHSVSVTIVQSMAAQSAIGDQRFDDARRRLTSIEETARHALADMRRLVTIEDDPAATPVGAQPRMVDLDSLIQRLRDGGAEVAFERRGAWADLPIGADLALFRITQEALTNAINHAPGASITVRIARDNKVVETDVTNGPPSRPDDGPGGGHGLLGMRERVQLYGGTLHAGARPDGGFQVRATLPLDAASR
jgi:signal transduction histidine kinase